MWDAHNMPWNVALMVYLVNLFVKIQDNPKF